MMPVCEVVHAWLGGVWMAQVVVSMRWRAGRLGRLETMGRRAVRRARGSLLASLRVGRCAKPCVPLGTIDGGSQTLTIVDPRAVAVESNVSVHRVVCLQKLSRVSDEIDNNT
jgi:hypothetical protein